MKNIKTLSITLITLIFVISGLVWGVSNTSIAKAATIFPEGSMIGGINVGEKTPDEAINLILDEVEKWKNVDEIKVTVPGQQISVPYNSITFDIQGSIKDLEEKVKKRWYEFFKKAQPKQVPLYVNVSLDEDIITQLGKAVDIEQTIKLMEETISYLGEHEIEAILSSDALLTEEIIAETTWTVPKDYGYLKMFIDKVNGLEIPANTNFSFNEQVASEVSHFGQKEGDFVASMIYALTLKTNLQVVERASQGEIPTYTKAGLEAHVNPKNNIDLVIYNPGPTSYKFLIQQAGSELNLALLSTPINTSHEYTIENETDVKFQTIIRYDEDLKPGHEQVIQAGQNGKRVEVYKTNRDSNGTVVSKELIARDFYLPQLKIILKSPVSDEESNVVEEETNISSDVSQIKEIINNNANLSELSTPDEVDENVNLEQLDLFSGEELTEEQLSELLGWLFLFGLLSSLSDENNTEQPTLEENEVESSL